MKNFLKKFFLKANKIQAKENTFLLWEPCSLSHAEVLPGYAKYLLDLGYQVSVLASPERFKEGLFDKFTDENLYLNKMSQSEIKKFFKNNDLTAFKGALITTVGKLCCNTNLSEAYNSFHSDVDKNKLFFVEHDVKVAVDEDRLSGDIITLRDLNYKNAKSVVVNPHYFGEVSITQKNDKVVNFIAIGAINPKRKNSDLIIEAVMDLYRKGYRDFKITVVGRGRLKNIPKEIRQFFDIKGRLTFSKMYAELEKSDYILTAYEKMNEQHQRYNTTGTSGNFQLSYGFLKPCIMLDSFSVINGFNKNNSILYSSNENYSEALERAINLSLEDYNQMQQELKSYTDILYKKSLNNLKNLITKAGV